MSLAFHFARVSLLLEPRLVTEVHEHLIPRDKRDLLLIVSLIALTDSVISFGKVDINDLRCELQLPVKKQNGQDTYPARFVLA
jgi:hypothetical protein